MPVLITKRCLEQADEDFSHVVFTQRVEDAGVVVGCLGKCGVCLEPTSILVCWCEGEFCDGCLPTHFAKCEAVPKCLRGTMA